MQHILDWFRPRYVIVSTICSVVWYIRGSFNAIFFVTLLVLTIFVLIIPHVYANLVIEAKLVLIFFSKKKKTMK
jgi:hypothetical protein